MGGSGVRDGVAVSERGEAVAVAVTASGVGVKVAVILKAVGEVAEKDAHPDISQVIIPYPITALIESGLTFILLAFLQIFPKMCLAN